MPDSATTPTDPPSVPPLAGATDDPFEHVPVLAGPLLEALADLPPTPAGAAPLLIDCTLGGGGHSALLLEAHPQLRLIGLDQDPTARAAAAARLAPFGERVSIVASNFAAFTPPEPAALVLADLGVSSPQLDVADRGFSFRADGPLDMRMNPEAGETVAELIARLEEAELADLIYAYGEERLSRRIARKIKAHLAEQGPFAGTAALAYLVAGCYPPAARRGRIHPATRTFQALRIAVNDELGVLDRLLAAAPDWLLPGGLVGVISFHSLEDRRVKTAFAGDGRLQRVTRKPLVADEAEQAANPRSRSAKLRVARRRPLESGASA
ncbi:16S rRNA (cytosine(1402)-N(4))-methyltransferase RsmH [Vulcanococcus limneticus Candia 3F8]|uniref:16S rRNA (cytosine(1402)-N(4))-methyltransferase RsmH n=1 Tax=Vulcanococcus limneticus TaxID=2170428 RepID=UPI000B99B5FA|nr:16S rRNA (cytosine(1402)-N(4))-methyltransferase RsmH [Vulcanococcus limneticus]MCP9792194.1 16S rRNA (cytosine(1402)-N(4))-methyltransferase RsmH [Vulcanococcus limneticus MW73D5]MCP9894434.1 16S rRNA (cytosine(1402)-N(4))-methyltransferase RsmH [Vulcanococcus limneticus Candia 3F8]MCP9897615.1 16S rRNA (cytosine(1402)-N(4))-methyltransferase RsmH [Vulcanococcus limneticus Candia 3B3]